MKSQVPLVLSSMDMEVTIPTFESLKTIETWIIIIKIGRWLLYAHSCLRDVCWELGPAFCLPQLSPQVSSVTSIKVLSSRHCVVLRTCGSVWSSKGHFTHETKSPWPVHFKHSHWWKRRSWSKFGSHYAWGTKGVSDCKMDVKSTWIIHGIEWIMFIMEHHLHYYQKTPLGGKSNTKPEDHGFPNAHNQWFIVFYRMRGPGHIWLWIVTGSHIHIALEGPWFWSRVGLWTPFLGSHNFIATALGSCVKWP